MAGGGVKVEAAAGARPKGARVPDRGREAWRTLRMLCKLAPLFAAATAVVFFSAVQHWGITPENLKEKPGYLFDYLRSVPTVWDETHLIDGYPGKYCVIARRKGTKWFVAAINGSGREKVIRVNLPMFKGKKVKVIADGENAASNLNVKTFAEDTSYELKLSVNGGVVLYM